MAQQEEQVLQQEISDQDIAEIARNEMAKRDEEIKKLRKELAIKSMYTQVDNQETDLPTREECVEALSKGDTSNYDYWVYALRLRDIELAAERPDPFGEVGEELSTFVKGLIDECADDKSSFSAVYQARLGKDRPEDLAAYKKALKLK